MILTDQALTVALARSVHMIAVRDDSGRTVALLTPQQATLLLTEGTQIYEVCGTKRRVRAIQVAKRSRLHIVKNPWHAHRVEGSWRESQAAVAWPWVDDTRSGILA